MNTYQSDISPMILEFILNDDLARISNWLTQNYLVMNQEKTQAMVLGKSSYTYNLLVDAKDIVLKDSLKILGVSLDCKLTFKDH